MKRMITNIEPKAPPRSLKINADLDRAIVAAGRATREIRALTNALAAYAKVKETE